MPTPTTNGGYRGSGVDRTQTRLADGTLSVVINELRILSLDTTAIGIDPAKFSLKPGDLYNYGTLLADVTRLAQGRSEDIRLEAQPVGNGVAVVFTAGPPASAGPIKRIDLEGNTVFTDAELEQQLELKVGETFTSALATDDFRRLLEFYAQAGYLLVQEPNFNFRDGTYSQHLREVKIAGYQVDLQTDTPRTKDRVITRYLPKVGSVYNQPEVERAILQINALQIARLTQVGTRISHALVPTDNPAQVDRPFYRARGAVPDHHPFSGIDDRRWRQFRGRPRRCRHQFVRLGPQRECVGQRRHLRLGLFARW